MAPSTGKAKTKIHVIVRLKSNSGHCVTMYHGEAVIVRSKFVKIALGLRIRHRVGFQVIDVFQMIQGGVSWE